MLFQYSEKTQTLIDRLQAFVDANILPADHEVHAWNKDPANLWKPWPGLEPLKEKAKAAGLWNLFLPPKAGPPYPCVSGNRRANKVDGRRL